MMRKLGILLAGLFVKLRLLVILAWIAGAAWITIGLPPISGQATSSFASLVPRSAPAMKAEKISAERFGFPLLTRTVIVVHDPHGLPMARDQQLVSLARRLSSHRVPGFSQIAGALPLINIVGDHRLARGFDTTALLYLYFHPHVSTASQTQVANRLIRTELGQRPGEFEGVTGAVPAEGAQTQFINSRLVWIELATILLVALAIAVHFRAPAAAGLMIATVAIAYLVSNRLVALFGREAGITIPAEAKPVLIVLVFGVVTDYSIFFISRFRSLLAEDEPRRPAAARVMREIAPIVTAAGLTVAAGTAALLTATMSYLRGFGPGLAIAVLISMIVAVTFVPAALAVGGRAMFWPSGLTSQSSGLGGLLRELGARRRRFAVRFATRHPIIATVLVLALIGGAASGLARMAIGNGLVTGLPGSSPTRHAYRVAERGFVPGVLAPTLVVVSGPRLASHSAALARLQTLLTHQPDVAEVAGPRGNLPVPRGFVVSRAGDTARYAVFLSSEPYGARAISAIERLREGMPRLLSRAGLPLATARVGGDTAISADLVSGTEHSLEQVIPTVLAAVFLVVAIFLRALVAPFYLVLTSLLATAASLGLTVYVMQMWIGYGQIAYYVLFTVAVLLISLGSDYNVFVVGRIWLEARGRSLRGAVESGASQAARPINTAGLVLATSFALLALVPLSAFRQIAFGMAVGLLIDTFVVRTILVPALMVLVGPRSAWPSRRLRPARVAPPVVTEEGPDQLAA